MKRQEGSIFGRRKKNAAVPEVGGDAPEFNLPSAQGGQFRLSMRTVRGPVVVAFFRPWSEEDVRFFGTLAEKEDEINMAGGSVVGIGVAEADAAREFVGASGIKSYVLYDYVKVTSRQWGLLENDKEHGDYSSPAVFVVGGDHQIANAWTGERPSADDVLAAVSAITGFPKPPEEKPKKGEKVAGDEGDKPKKLTAEEREKIKAERRAAREAGKSVKTGEAAKKPETEKEGGEASGGGEATEGEKPKKMSAEERARIKAERRAAREAGKSLKKPADSGDSSAGTDDAATDGEPEKKPAEGD